MVDREREEQRADLVSRLFVLLTSRFEDAATIAAECQGMKPAEELTKGLSNCARLVWKRQWSRRRSSN